MTLLYAPYPWTNRKMFQAVSVAPVPAQSRSGAAMLDEMDVKILRILQEDSTRSVADVGKEVGRSTTPCCRRIQKLEEAGIIKRRVAVLDPPSVNAGVTVFVSIKTDQHSLAWLEKFHAAVVDFPEVVE